MGYIGLEVVKGPNCQALGCWGVVMQVSTREST